MSSKKWFFLGGLLTAINLAWLLAGSLNAAPGDIQGSGNVAVASYTTSKGSYILWSSGRITEAKSGKTVAPPYGPAEGFTKASVEKGTAVGSPRVAVDYVQNSKGTYTLFADGSVQKADDEGASAPAGGSVKIKFGVAMPNSMPPIEHGIDMPDTFQSGTTFSLKEPFEEGGIAVMPMKSSGLPDPNFDGMLGAFRIDENGAIDAGIAGPTTLYGTSMIWDGRWVIAIGK